MELNKETIKKILFILFAAIAFCIGLINISSVWRFLLSIAGIFTPVIIGLCIAFILSPLTALLEKRLLAPLKTRFPKKGRSIARGLGVFLSLIIIKGLIAQLLLLIVPEVEEAFKIIGKTLPAALTRLIENINAVLGRFEDFERFKIPLGGASDWLNLIENATDYIAKAFDNGALSDIANTALSVVSGFWNFVLGLILSIYVLMQKARIGGFMSRLIRAYFSKRAAARIFRTARLSRITFRNFVTGQLTEAVIIGALCFFGMLLFRFPYPTATSAVVGVMALIPVFGAWIGGILGALLSLSDSFTRALLFILFLIILQQLENNLIYPRVVGKSIGLPGILVFVSVILGASVGGVFGILLAVPVCSIGFVFIKEGIDKRLGKKKAVEDPEKTGIPADE
ncbi:MAG: AI-2E family transporter [Oscillospiraceae bacterium]|jgi:predicted PurR-regulated permease PerM|nr:AI-2E family transporter [Oscillospiraceae bacterium]